MYRYHDNADACLVLNLLDAESPAVTAGVELSVLEFAWNRHGHTDKALARALDLLAQEGLVAMAHGCLRLSTSGYQRVLADVPEIEAPAAAPHQSQGTDTEYGLRNAVLAVMRSRGLGANAKISAGELNQLWEVARQRAADLRTGLDLLMRDGHVKLSRLGKTRFRLEKDGYLYMTGREAPPEFVGEALRVDDDNLAQSSVSDMTLCVLIAQLYRETRSKQALSFGVTLFLLEQYKLPEFATFHGLDVAHRRGYLDWDAKLRGFVITESGRQLQRKIESTTVRWGINSDLAKLGNGVQL